MICLMLLLFLVCLTPNAASEPITIGGLFEKDNASSNNSSIEEMAFKFAINKIRNRLDLNYNILNLDSYGFVPSSKAACLLMEGGVAAIFGPSNDQAAAYVSSVCDAMKIPFIERRREWKKINRLGINLYPSMSKVISDMFDYYSWSRSVIVYHSKEDLAQLETLLSTSINRQITIILKQLPISLNFHPILEEIKEENVNKILVACDLKIAQYFAEQALEEQMLTTHYHYIFTSLDIEEMDLGRYMHAGVNFTAFHLIDTEFLNNDESILEEWNRFSEDELTGKPQNLTTGAALTYDAVYTFATALESLSRERNVSIEPVSCHKSNKWSLGKKFFKYLRNATLTGITGPIAFDEDGSRSKFKLQILIAKKGFTGLKKLGEWSSTKGINFTFPVVANSAAKNRTLIITTILEPPYVMEKKADIGQELTGNDRFEGFCIDMLNDIARIIGFDFNITLVPDGKYGGTNEKGNWNGMVGELLNKRADMAVAPLTINFVREEVMDFSSPFMYLGIGILYRSPEKLNSGMFSFLTPLHADVWIGIVGAYFAVSLIMTVIARFDPYEWENSHPVNPELDDVEITFNFGNSLWFNFGGLMQQGSDLVPKAFSMRVISGVWWFFTLILIASFTANLAAHLTVERLVTPIESADDLAKQTEIKYGTLGGGSTISFFEKSKIPVYQSMWNFMSARMDDVIVENTSVGIARVAANRNYAFLMESTMLEYIVSKNCNLSQVGGLLDTKGYGIGLQKDSPLLNNVSEAILQLQEMAKLQEYKIKWWNGFSECSDTADTGGPSSLGFQNIGGIFLILLVGTGIGFGLMFLEFIWKSIENAKKDNKNFCVEMIVGCNFAFRGKDRPRRNQNGNETMLTTLGPPDSEEKSRRLRNVHAKQVEETRLNNSLESIERKVQTQVRYKNGNFITSAAATRV